MAARFFVVGGVDTNWGTLGNWSTTSGGGGGSAVPLATDDVTIDGSSGSAVVLNTSARVAKTLTINGFTGTITFDQQLSVSGSITFTTTAFTFAGATTNRLRMIAAGTWTTNGQTIPQNVEIGGTTTFTCTLAGALTTSGDLFLTNTTSTIFSGNFLTTAANATISGSQTITNSGNFQINGVTTVSDANSINGAGKEWRTAGLTTTGTLIGSSTLVFNGTGTWTGAAGGLGMAGGISINTAGTLTISGTVIVGGGGAIVLTYVTGTVTTTGSTLAWGLSGDQLTLDSDGITWNVITFNAAAPLVVSSALLCATFTPTGTTITLNALLTVTGTMTLPNGSVTFAGSSGWTVGTLTNTTITATRTWTFTGGRTYTDHDSFATVHAAAQTVRFTLTAASSTNFVLGPGATQDIGFVDPTNMDASLGQKIFSYHGVITTSPNWANTRPPNVAIAWPITQVGI